MEIQSGNGEEVASVASPSGSQLEASDDPAHRADLQAARRIERFDIPLDTLKKMFEKSAEANAVSSAAEFSFFYSRGVFVLSVSDDGFHQTEQLLQQLSKKLKSVESEEVTSLRGRASVEQI